MSSFLFDRYVRDLQKPDVDCFERAALIREYIEDNDTSIRGFSTHFGIARGTVEDWLLWNRIPENKYKELREKGLTHLQIYNTLREKKRNKEPVGYVDVTLTDLKNKIRTLRRYDDYTHKTLVLIRETVNELNQLEVHINLKQKRGNKTS